MYKAALKMFDRCWDLFLGLCFLAVALLFTASDGQAQRPRENCSSQINFLNEFLKLETAGGRLKSSGRIYSMISDDTNWETATVIDGYTLDSCRVTGEDSTIRVVFHVIGTVASSMNGSPDYFKGPKDEITEFHVFKLTGKWKVVDLDQFRPHVSPVAAANSIDPSYGQRAKRAIASLKSAAGN